MESDEVTTTEVQVLLPQTFSFAIVASASEAVVVEGGGEITDDDITVQSTTQGGALHFHQSSFLPVLLGVFTATLLLLWVNA